MPAPAKQSETIDSYIGSFAPRVRTILEQVRQIIRSAAPEATETIGYGIPTFRQGGASLSHFAGWKRHISLYPIPSDTEAFGQELAPYEAAKGTLRFPLDKPVPFDLISKIVEAHLKAIRQDA